MSNTPTHIFTVAHEFAGEHHPGHPENAGWFWSARIFASVEDAMENEASPVGRPHPVETISRGGNFRRDFEGDGDRIEVLRAIEEKYPGAIEVSRSDLHTLYHGREMARKTLVRAEARVEIVNDLLTHGIAVMSSVISNEWQNDDIVIVVGGRSYRFSPPSVSTNRWSCSFRWGTSGSSPFEAFTRLMELEGKTDELAALYAAAPKVVLEIEGIGTVEVADRSAEEPIPFPHYRQCGEVDYSRQLPFPNIRRFTRRTYWGGEETILHFEWGKRETACDFRKEVEKAVKERWGSTVSIGLSL